MDYLASSSSLDVSLKKRMRATANPADVLALIERLGGTTTDGPVVVLGINTDEGEESSDKGGHRNEEKCPLLSPEGCSTLVSIHPPMHASIYLSIC